MGFVTLTARAIIFFKLTLCKLVRLVRVRLGTPPINLSTNRLFYLFQNSALVSVAYQQVVKPIQFYLGYSFSQVQEYILK